MKRILIFSTAYHPFIGGAEIAVKEITDRTSDIQFDMITINLDGKQRSPEKIGNITVYRIGKPGKISKLFFPFSAKKKALELHAQKPYDAIWSIMASFSGFAALFFKKKMPKIPFILTLQEGDPISYIKHQVWFVYPWFQQIFRKADRIQTISHYLADFAKSMGATCPITVIPNGVDLSLFVQKNSDEHKEVMRQTLSKKPGDVFLITTSRLVKKNAIADVIQALALLPAHIQFIILGKGELEPSLKQLAKKLHLEKRVRFAGHFDHIDIPNYLAASDIFIRPSLSEGMGNSFIEAMAARIPVIATPVGGIPDFLKDPSTNKDQATGIFCEVHNPQSIAEKVQLLMSDKVLRGKIIGNAYTLVTTRYDWNLIVERMKTEIFATV